MESTASKPNLYFLVFMIACLCPDLNGYADRTKQHSPPRIIAADTWFPLALGPQEIQVQLALTEREQRRGLMERTDLRDNEGMLFVYKQPKKQTFWMFATPLPLSIAYFSPDGTLREIHKLYPHDRSTVVSRRTDIQFCLEMKQGWFQENQVGLGTQLNLQLLRQALEARGYPPQQYGL